MGKDMTSFYALQTTHHLHELKSQKHNRMTKLRREASTYLNLQEIRKLTEQMRWIEAELQCRADQMALL